jgi:hypothetical protein
MQSRALLGSMKTFLCLLAFALVLGQPPCLRGFGFESVSPDGQWRVANVGFSLQLFDRTGQGGLILELDLCETWPCLTAIPSP